MKSGVFSAIEAQKHAHSQNLQLVVVMLLSGRIGRLLTVAIPRAGNQRMRQDTVGDVDKTLTIVIVDYYDVERSILTYKKVQLSGRS